MNRTRTLRAAALLAALAPLSLAAAQEKPVADKPAAEKPAGPTFTPYGFLLLDAFFDSGPFVNKDNANQVKPEPAPGTAAYADSGGDFVASARGSRFGARLDNLDSGLLAAKLSGVLEFDFKGGHLATNSSGWNAFIPRLRLAFARADWKTAYGAFNVVAGQDYALLLNVNPNTVTYNCDPVFVQSGNLYRRTPQVRVGWDLKQQAFGLTAAVGVLSPSDIDTQGLTGASAVDTGAGNKSRQPDFEARVAVSAKAPGDVSGTLGVGYHVGKRRYFFTEAGAGVTRDLTSTLLGIDADLSLTKYLQVKGEYYDNEGTEDGYAGGFPGSFPSNPPPNAAAPSPFELVTSNGWWAQATLKPVPFLWLAGGYGVATASRSRLSTTAASTRYENNQVHGALIFNASKSLKMSLELARTQSRYVVEGSFEATQASFATQLFF